MRRARFNYVGSLHHVMNRGMNGENIFPDDDAKQQFLTILGDRSNHFKIRLIAYCIMDNHYHLILQNTSGKLSDFMRELNGNYGAYYRFHIGGKGYVFQSRYKSTLIEDEKYLRVAIVYVLLNPVRKQLVKIPAHYPWTSLALYFQDKTSHIVDIRYAEDLFETKDDLLQHLADCSISELPIIKTRMGYLLGERSNIEPALLKSDRRKKDGETHKMRTVDYSYEKPDMVIRNFEESIGKKVDTIDTHTREGKALRIELLIQLKDLSGLNFSKIIRYPLFKDLKYTSLSQLYKRYKLKKENN